MIGILLSVTAKCKVTGCVFAKLCLMESTFASRWRYMWMEWSPVDGAQEV